VCVSVNLIYIFSNMSEISFIKMTTELIYVNILIST